MVENTHRHWLDWIGRLCGAAARPLEATAYRLRRREQRWRRRALIIELEQIRRDAD